LFGVYVTWQLVVRAGAIVNVKLTDADAPALSVAVAVRTVLPVVVGVPEIVVVELVAEFPRENPAGSPVADHVMVAAGLESLAVSVMDKGTPTVPCCGPGLVSRRVLLPPSAVCTAEKAGLGL
jgi:hypothetical protein